MQSNRLWLLAGVAATSLVAGCSGGGAGDPRVDPATLSVSLADAPVDGLMEVNVEIAAMWIKPADGPAVQLTLTKTPLEVDLLAHTGDNAEILIDEAAIEPGHYEWLAMDVNARFDNVYDSYVVNGMGGQEEIRVPSGRVRLVSGFDVTANQALKLIFDWDMRSGLVDPPGQPGFLLKPAFRLLDVSAYGVLEGTVAPETLTAEANACAADDEDLDVGNVVYVFAGAGVTPDDIDAIDPDPVATAEVQPNDAGDYVYRVLLGPGTYTAAFTCQAANDDPEVDETATPAEIAFQPAADVTIAGDTVTADF
jgi:Domain of unknown function (DUF4382)